MKQSLSFFAVLSLTAGSLFTAGTLAAADPELMNLVMPDAKVIAGVNVEQAKTTQFVQWMLSQAPDGAHFDQFIAATGFDPRRDLKEILVASAGQPVAATAVTGTLPGALPGENSKPHHAEAGLLIARGTFDSVAISAAAVKEGDMKSETYQGATLITPVSSEENHAVAIIDNSIAIAGDLANVKGALDRRSQNNTIDPALAAKVNELSNSLDAWSVSIAPLSQLGFMNPTSGANDATGHQPNPFKTIQQASGGVKFGTTVNFTGEALASSDKDATSLSDVIRFLASMAQSSAEAQPVAALLQTLNVTTSGSWLKISLSVPEDQLEAVLNSAKAGHVHAEPVHGSKI